MRLDTRAKVTRREGKVYVTRAKPAKPRVVVDPRMCGDKHRDPDELTARARATTRLASKDCTIDKLYVYACKFCRGWHLTRNPYQKGAPVTRDSTYAVTSK